MNVQQLYIEEVFTLRDKFIFLAIRGKADKFRIGDVFTCVDDAALSFRITGIGLPNFRNPEAYSSNPYHDLLVDELTSDAGNYKGLQFQKAANASESTSE